MNPRYLSFALAGALALLGPTAVADTSTKVDGYTIHHIALTTDMLDPQVARTYGLQRSKNRGFLNVSLVKEVAGTLGQSTPAEVTARAKNLTGQVWDLPMREVKEGKAYYYITDFLVAHNQTLSFDITVKPAGATKPFQVRMSQEFFTQ